MKISTLVTAARGLVRYFNRSVLKKNQLAELSDDDSSSDEYIEQSSLTQKRRKVSDEILVDESDTETIDVIVGLSEDPNSDSDSISVASL